MGEISETPLIAIRRIRSDREITIPNSPENNLFFNAFTSAVFQKKVEAGARRLISRQAESRFLVISNGRKIIYSPLVLGGTHPTNESETRLGLEASVGEPEMKKFFERYQYTPENYGYFVIGDFHFHPVVGGFSSSDVESYDENYSRVGHSRFPHQRDYFTGVFAPNWKVELGKGRRQLTSLSLLMFAGPPTDLFYQGADFERETPKSQKEILEKSGMKVILVDLPILLIDRRRQADLDPLKSALQELGYK